MLRQSLFLSTPADIFKWTGIDSQYSYFVVIWNNQKRWKKMKKKKNKHKRTHRQERKNYLNMWESVFFFFFSTMQPHTLCRVLTLKHMSLICTNGIELNIMQINWIYLSFRFVHNNHNIFPTFFWFFSCLFSLFRKKSGVFITCTLESLSNYLLKNCSNTINGSNSCN